MPSDASLPLQILGAGPARSPWQLPAPYPSTLLALWPGVKPPGIEVVLEALLETTPGVEILGELPATPGTLWLFAVALPAPAECRAIIFAEPSDALPDVSAGEADSGAPRPRFTVGIEFVAARERVLATFGFAMAALRRIVPETSAILDVAASTWHHRAGLDRWFGGAGPTEAETARGAVGARPPSSDRAAAALDPPEWLLWSTHAVTRSREPAPDEPAWVRTSGLWRCGLPELEILEVPAAHLRAAVALVNGIAGLLLEGGPPDPLRRWRVGHGLEVVLAPWRTLAAALDPERPGSFATRGLEDVPAATESLAHPFGGIRAAICDPEPRGLYRPRWSWPQGAIEALERGDGALDQPELAAQRTRRAAQRTLDVLRAAVEPRRGDEIAPRVDAPEAPGAPRGRPEERRGPTRALLEIAVGLAPDASAAIEHAWLEVDRCVGDAFECRVLDDAILAGALTAGARRRVEPSEVTDWQVRIDGTTAGPDDAPELAEILESRRRRVEEPA
ncbi:MAG TPA: hypothetical protein PKC43_01755 [Phycisphaerales bacterium]|nr:hypothetical protein [Phycisphaerales bacterium]HMP36150.1 hypothetical protein [Phycisphaerales bacterium]